MTNIVLSSSSGELFYAALSPNHSNEEVAATNQEFLLLHGLAGSGKSFVIRARKALAESWEHPKAVRTCAPTG
jgi:chromosomal replication initiation ATPase DnaA